MGIDESRDEGTIPQFNDASRCAFVQQHLGFSPDRKNARTFDSNSPGGGIVCVHRYDVVAEEDDVSGAECGGTLQNAKGQENGKDVSHWVPRQRMVDKDALGPALATAFEHLVWS